ncbi:MAG TPA: 6-hydroxymethylpterin diphosphokinase MptE-like protein [Methanocella sp.]|uniref:6-hydroxymethylpterin diphosphokinase MptE-like protein n=1 Tax=Methanocella sp. TaxID=2052833 RepID=UPI002CE01C10|nr:6-hydroxymethylpterin diphosphokinase MptE-like protein [Methanocella sp.]HTY91495.1 6-hydroxymethylpterin diphosphokinase MptE-like protein [Methanocella sp.]
MKFEEWEPYYRAILDDFGWTPEGDEEAARLLSSMLPEDTPCLDKVKELIHGKDIIVCGKAPSLQEDMANVDWWYKYTVIAADGAVSTLLDQGIVPDIVVSDLDGKHEDLLEADSLGSIILAHAHADNAEAVRSLVPKLKHVAGTTQARPLKNVYNFGGFSDGDRCVFLAKEFGAKSIKIIGFDLDDTKVTPKKLKKLKWARKLLGVLGIRL